LRKNGERAPTNFAGTLSIALGRGIVQYGIENFGIREVTVNEQNPSAVGFYEHIGFSPYRRTDRDEQNRPFPPLYMRL
jgi:putative acetyltransferase